MTKTSKILLISGALVLGAAAFVYFWFDSHTDDAHLRYIPDDAAAVFSVHNREIAAKIDPSKLESLKPAQDAVKDIPDFMVNLLTDPMATGIDPIQNIYGFVDKDKQSTVSALVIALNSESDFTAFVEKVFTGKKAEDLGDFNYLDIDDARGMAWNDDAAVFVAVNEADVRAYTEALFAQSEDESIRKDTSFGNFNAKTFDAGLWTNNNRLAVLNDQTSPLALVGMREGHSNFFLRFEQNEIVAEYVAPKNASATIFKAQGPTANDLNMLGTKDPLFFMGMVLDIKNLLAAAETDAAMQQNLAMMTGALGMTDEEMNKLFTGSITVAISDYKNIYDTDPRVQQEAREMLGPMASVGGVDVSAAMLGEFSIEVPVMCLGIGITDQKRATDIMTGIGMKKMEENFWAAPGISMVIYTVITPTHMIITNDYLSAQAVLKDGKLPGKLPADYAAMVPAQPFSMYMDFNKEHMPALLLNPESPTLSAEDLAGFVSLGDFLSSMRYESDATTSTFRFILPESSDNSVIRALKYLQP